MNIYLISQTVKWGYDTFDSAVVAAPDEETAKNMLPADWVALASILCVWCKPEDVQVKYIGVTDLPQSVICASFNAG